MRVLFRAPCPTRDGQEARFHALPHRRTREGARAFSERRQVDDEPGEVALLLEGDVGLVPPGGS